MNLYLDDNSLWNVGGWIGIVAGSCFIDQSNDDVAVRRFCDGAFIIPFTDPTNICKDSEGTKFTDLDDILTTCCDFFVNASSDGGDTPTIITQSGSNSLAIDTLVKARSVTITEGTWTGTGNIYCDGDAVSSGYVKAALNESNNTFTTNETTQIDIDSNENDFGFSVMPKYITVTENTTIFLNFAREIALTAVTLYSKVQAIKIVG